MKLVLIMRGLIGTGKAPASHIRGGGMGGCSLNNADWAQRCMFRNQRKQTIKWCHHRDMKDIA